MTNRIGGYMDYGKLLAKPAAHSAESESITEHSVTDRIRALASQGLKPHDISALLGVHPQMVLLLLDAPNEGYGP